MFLTRVVPGLSIDTGHTVEALLTDLHLSYSLIDQHSSSPLNKTLTGTGEMLNSCN